MPKTTTLRTELKLMFVAELFLKLTPHEQAEIIEHMKRLLSQRGESENGI